MYPGGMIWPSKCISRACDFTFYFFFGFGLGVIRSRDNINCGYC